MFEIPPITQGVDAASGGRAVSGTRRALETALFVSMASVGERWFVGAGFYGLSGRYLHEIMR